MAGIVDVSVSKPLPKDEMILVLNCMNGFPHDLHELHDGAVVTVKKDEAERQVLIRRGQGDECGFHYIEVGTAIAEALELRDGARYQIQYDELSKTLVLTRALVSRIQVPLQIVRRKHKAPAVTIGYAQLCMLGMAAKLPAIVTLIRGPVTAKLRLIVPNNELDKDFRISAATAARLGLSQGQACQLEYNQSTKALTLTASGAPIHRIPIQEKKERDKSDLTGSRSSSAASVRRPPVSEKATKHGSILNRQPTRTRNKPTAAHSVSNLWLNGKVAVKLR